MKKIKKSSLRKIESNRENSRSSTGPKTADGQARASLNAVKHGLNAKSPLLMHERKQDRDAVVDRVFSQWNPFTPEQTDICLLLVDMDWKEGRGSGFETALINSEIRRVVMDRTFPVEDAAYTIGSEKMRSNDEAIQILTDHADKLVPTELDVEIAYRRILENQGELYYRLNKLSQQRIRQRLDLISMLHRLRREQADQKPGEQLSEDNEHAPRELVAAPPPDRKRTTRKAKATAPKPTMAKGASSRVRRQAGVPRLRSNTTRETSGAPTASTLAGNPEARPFRRPEQETYHPATRKPEAGTVDVTLKEWDGKTVK